MGSSKKVNPRKVIPLKTQEPWGHFVIGSEEEIQGVCVGGEREGGDGESEKEGERGTVKVTLGFLKYANFGG